MNYPHDSECPCVACAGYREQIATLRAERDAAAAELTECAVLLLRAVKERDAARRDCDGFIARYRDDGDRMRNLCGEVWRLGGFGGPEGLAHMALDRGGATVAALVAERDAAIQRAERAEAKLAQRDVPSDDDWEPLGH